MFVAHGILYAAKSTPVVFFVNFFSRAVILAAPIPLGMSGSVWQKCVDPDNKSGFGEDPNDEQDSFGNTIPKPNDNYGYATFMLDTTIPGGANYGTSNMTIDSVYAGDNYRMVVHPNNGVLVKGIFATDAVTFSILDTPTTTKTFTQSSILTVWRSLWVECDVMEYKSGLFNLGTTRPESPASYIGGFVKTQLERACIAIREYKPNNTPLLPKSTPILLGANPMELVHYEALTGYGGVGPGIGRDSEFTTDAYWTVRIAMASTVDAHDIWPDQYPTPNKIFPSGVYQPEKNTIVVFYERLNSLYSGSNLSTAIEQTLLHEIGHILTLNDDNDPNTTEGVMKQWADPLQAKYQKFLPENIKRIQKNSKIAVANSDFL